MFTKTNILIADFMRMSMDGDCYVSKDLNFAETAHYLKYNSEWSWLMPVVEKIESLSVGEYLSFSVDIESCYCRIKGYEKNRQPATIHQSIYGKEYNNKMEAVYEAVIEFIKFYSNPKEYWASKFSNMINPDVKEQ